MSKERYFVACDNCGCSIYFEDDFYTLDGFCGVYCSSKCFCESYASIKTMNIKQAHNCRCDVYRRDYEKETITPLEDEEVELASFSNVETLEKMTFYVWLSSFATDELEGAKISLSLEFIAI